jgi:hypothetical protein
MSGTKRDYIDMIEKTFPIDSRFQDVSQEGIEILSEIMEENPELWRLLPDRILKLFAEKCEARGVPHEIF